MSRRGLRIILGEYNGGRVIEYIIIYLEEDNGGNIFGEGVEGIYFDAICEEGL